ncbi:hypothetical protein [Streptomyces sp. enrichment culture]|uniref:hypothetical protein n=1 Tax=Streptomyces sp. enrichment culture TaxID=1795815 RepID=UPI003F56ABA8
MNARQIIRVLKRSLATGLHVSRVGGSQGFGHLVINDHHGEGLLAVNVQRWSRQDPAVTRLFASASELPNGSLIKIDRRPSPYGGEGAVVWTVDVLHEDGLRVVAATVNAAAYYVPASRDLPAVTIAQLKRIALDPAWQEAPR